LAGSWIAIALDRGFFFGGGRTIVCGKHLTTWMEAQI
jgi:hypothetical protein